MADVVKAQMYANSALLAKSILPFVFLHYPHFEGASCFFVNILYYL